MGEPRASTLVRLMSFEPLRLSVLKVEDRDIGSNIFHSQESCRDAHVHRHRRLPRVFGKLSHEPETIVAQIQPLPAKCF
jgi:hypothetical protein